MIETLDTIDIKPFSTLDIDSFFVYEVEEIEMAFRISSLLHKGAKNIVSGGNEVELAIRNFFSRKLTSKYYVSNGHVIDSNLKVSSQFDIIIADNNKSPILYQTKDKTDFLIYDSIYAIGEVKKSWYSKELLNDFSKTISRMNSELKRREVDPKFVDIGGKGAYFSTPTTENRIKNPIFYFLFVVQSEKLNMSDIKNLYQNASWNSLPSALCLLDKGLIVNINKKLISKGELKINLYPQFIDKNDNEWVLINLRDKSSVLAYFYLLLVEHLNSTVLHTPLMFDYLKHMFNVSLVDIHSIK